MKIGKVVGYNAFTSKAGKECMTLGYTVECNAHDNVKGRFGNKYEDDFVPDNLRGAVTSALFGKEIEIEHAISNGRAYLDSFVVVNVK